MAHFYLKFLIYTIIRTLSNNILRYSMQIAMLKQLLVKKLINKIEYYKIKDELMKDYKISSDLTS